MIRSDLRGGSPFSSLMAVAVLSMLGCASPGPPQPPSLGLPNLPTGLAADRVSGEVRLTWSTSASSTDGDRVRGQIAALICREDTPRNASPKVPSPACVPVRRVPVAPGHAEVTDLLPRDLSTGTPMLLRYRVELVNDRGRSAGWSDPVYAAGGEAPGPVGLLTISARREAALIQWQTQAGLAPGTVMEVRRTLAAKAPGLDEPVLSAAPRIPAFKDGSSGSSKGSSKAAANTEKGPAEEVTLIAKAEKEFPGTSPDPGGTIDTGVRTGNSYLYRAQRVETVDLRGHKLELRGVPSPPASFAYRDTFPPSAPSGLVSVPAGGFGAAPGIDLSWEPNVETDLLGYNIYRREGPDAFRKLNQEPLPVASFRDAEVRSGNTYRYRVTAVDRRQNESKPSPEVYESVRP